ncbi:MAG: mannose-6-phosphate isomerase, class I [Eubacterium sp.]|nr:mannose-6-phosphate isomerase, class I [Eubacterium sp.]
MEQKKEQQTKKNEILFLDPVCKENIWGGSRLKQEFHYASAGEQTGECWGISAHPNGDGTVRGGTFDGMHLSRLWKEQPQLFGNPDTEQFPLLAKIIDAREDLSIQVHPDDSYAKLHENGANGKTECWYIMDCTQPASLIIGHHASTKEELVQMIDQGKWNELLREVPVKKGDFIKIDPGTVHAIKGGCLIFETQQNSDITYRLYDYGRLSNGKPRELHLEKSIDVIQVPAKDMEECIFSADGLAKNQMHLLLDCPYFKVFKIDVEGCVRLDQPYPFLAVSVLEGSGCIDGNQIQKGDHFILPSGYGSFCLEGEMSLIASAG